MIWTCLICLVTCQHKMHNAKQAQPCAESMHGEGRIWASSAETKLQLQAAAAVAMQEAIYWSAPGQAMQKLCRANAAVHISV